MKTNAAASETLIASGRDLIRDTVSRLEEVRRQLENLALQLPSPAEAMLELEEPQDVPTAMLGVLEHTLQEHLEPMIADLSRVATTTGDSLVEEFQRYLELTAASQAELGSGGSGPSLRPH